jgi:antitoxin ParD1/3/4
METIDIALRDRMKEFVDDLVRQGDFSSASDYVQALIHEDRRRRAKERLEAHLLEGLVRDQRPR